MSASWMKPKLLKLKRDGMADSRGSYARFSDKPSKSSPRATRLPGWYAVGQDKRALFGTYRGAVRSIGPFPSHEAARRAARAMFEGETVKTFQI